MTGRFGRAQGTGKSFGAPSPVAPSTCSRSRSACPVWRAYSSIMSASSRRRLIPSWVVCSRPPRDNASARASRERCTVSDPERAQGVGRVVGRRAPGPVLPVALEVQLVERRHGLATGQPVLEVELLDPRQVLEQASQRHRRRTEPQTQPLGVHIGALPREREPVALQGDHGGVDLVTAHEALDVPLWWLAGREAEGARHAATIGMPPDRTASGRWRLTDLRAGQRQRSSA